MSAELRTNIYICLKKTNTLDINEMLTHQLTGELEKAVQSYADQEKEAYHLSRINEVSEEETIERLKDDMGREGCTYGDTDYDSMTVVYGYNLGVEHTVITLLKILKNTK